MFLTRECDYAVRIVRALSDYEKRPVKDISEMEYIPFQFAYKVLKKLEKSKLVSSYRGVYGGYQLTKKLEDITLLDILVSVDEELVINECLIDGFKCPNDTHSSHCSVHIELIRIQALIESTLQEKSMAQILETI